MVAATGMTSSNFQQTIIGEATSNAVTNIIKYLEGKGVSIFAQSDDGETVLFSAAWDGHLELVKYLADKGADLNAKRRRINELLQQTAREPDNIGLFEELGRLHRDLNEFEAAEKWQRRANRARNTPGAD